MSQMDQQKLKDYFSGKLSSAEQHEVEKWMMENPFEADALEGLRSVQSEQKIHATVNQLNKHLHNYLQDKKNKRRRKLSSSNNWAYLAVFIILLLIIMAYLIIRSI